jgi:hypothetical protein
MNGPELPKTLATWNVSSGLMNLPPTDRSSERQRSLTNSPADTRFWLRSLTANIV